ncbi:hypothetical protein E3N88_18500 [Mikania micrantha]|uniref:Uncharacterized protein n=1 Tax=Mikania micrantha TaxID=192012 RepID=A0A5N6NKZ9_9ASTR|nr:hypothetical protein E3N88_18500 [Mikania micrantha]
MTTTIAPPHHLLADSTTETTATVVYEGTTGAYLNARNTTLEHFWANPSEIVSFLVGLYRYNKGYVRKRLTSVRAPVGDTDPFPVEVGRCQGEIQSLLKVSLVEFIDPSEVAVFLILRAGLALAEHASSILPTTKAYH